MYYIHQTLSLASFPGPAQLSIAFSTVKQERAWYLFSCEWRQDRKDGRKGLSYTLSVECVVDCKYAKRSLLVWQIFATWRLRHGHVRKDIGLSLLFRTASDGKLGGAWERGYPLPAYWGLAEGLGMRLGITLNLRETLHSSSCKHASYTDQLSSLFLPSHTPVASAVPGQSHSWHRDTPQIPWWGLGGQRRMPVEGIWSAIKTMQQPRTTAIIVEPLS